MVTVGPATEGFLSWYQLSSTFPTLDDCADQANIPLGSQSFAQIRVKSRYGRDFYELSIMLGTIELLAVGGFHGNAVSCGSHAFLGSSISNLPPQLKQSQRASNIHIRVQPCRYTSSNRHIQQYCKAASGQAWALHSFRSVTKAFYPVNPLAYGDHLPSLTRNGRILHLLASYILSCAACQCARHEAIDSMFTLAFSDKKLAGHLESCQSFTASSEHLLESGDTDSLHGNSDR